MYERNPQDAVKVTSLVEDVGDVLRNCPEDGCHFIHDCHINSREMKGNHHISQIISKINGIVGMIRWLPSSSVESI